MSKSKPASRAKIHETIVEDIEIVDDQTQRPYQQVPVTDIEPDTDNQKKFKFKGYFYALLTACCYPLSNVFLKKAYILNGADQMAFQFIFTLIVMLVIVKYYNFHPLGPKDQRTLLHMRGLIGSVGILFFLFGILLIPPSDCSAVSHTSVIITAILARFILKEKLGIAHLFSIILTVIGVLFISKPEFLFKNSSDAVENCKDCGFLGNKNYMFYLGVGLVVGASFFFGLLSIIIKKLSNSNVHWSVTTIYSAYYGILVGLPISILMYVLGYSHQNLKDEIPQIPMQFFYSVLAGIFGLLGTIFVNKALDNEDPTKVSIVKTSDVLIAFVLQLFILNVTVDMLSITGSAAILLGTFTVLSFGLIESRMKSSKKSLCSKILLFKF